MLADIGTSVRSAAARLDQCFELGLAGRTFFGALYLLVQVGLVLTAPQRVDGAFAFRMFNESSTIAIHLARKVRRADGGTMTVPIDGTWMAKDPSGALETFRWKDRVQDPNLGTLGRPVHASYGVAAQLLHLQRALDDVASHIPHDTETISLVARVEAFRNGHERFETTLESPARTR